MYAANIFTKKSEFTALCSQRVFQRGLLQDFPGTFEKWTFIFCPFLASDAISFLDFYREC
jgi:hypothetical protein